MRCSVSGVGAWQVNLHRRRTRVRVAERVPTPQCPVRIRIRSGKQLFRRHEAQAGVEREFWPAVEGRLVSARATERTAERGSLTAIGIGMVRTAARCIADVERRDVI